MAFWSLEILEHNGTTAKVCGTEETMKMYYEEIKEALGGVDGTGAKVIEVHGMFDSIDRAEISRLICVDRISIATVLKMY